jgi:N-methylhydantoinase B
MTSRQSREYPRHCMFDPVELEIFKNIFYSIAEEMGASLRRTAFSPNIKERRDYSCALFDAGAQVIAMGDHMPVHLGSMPMSVQAAIAKFHLAPGDVAMLNDPFAGGTHLPDITLVAPVYVRKSSRKDSPDFFVAARAHHADVGGAYAGSMGLCREIYQEGFRIPPVKLVRSGKVDHDVLALLLANVRTPGEREGDLNAEIAACHTGAARILEVCARYGFDRVKRAADELLSYSDRMMRTFVSRVPAGTHSAEDFLDDDGVTDDPVRIAVKITFGGGGIPPLQKTQAWGSQQQGSFRSHSSLRKRRASKEWGTPAVTVDFTGSSSQVAGSINAVAAIAWSAVFYVFRCLLPEDVPATAGLMRCVRVISPEGTVVNALPPAAVAGGNVETSQRIVDALLRALAKALPDCIPAAASGTMNNFTVGGIDPRTRRPFAYYETVAGGMGARPDRNGVSGVHTHMTNSLNTPAEALEYAYPVRITRYSLRRGSGGRGRFTGGDGIVREIEVLTDCDIAILSDRRKRGPWGLNGGQDGLPGRTSIIRANGAERELRSKDSARVSKGERVRIETPGGGGWGRSDSKRKC